MRSAGLVRSGCWCWSRTACRSASAPPFSGVPTQHVIEIGRRALLRQLRLGCAGRGCCPRARRQSFPAANSRAIHCTWWWGRVARSRTGSFTVSSPRLTGGMTSSSREATCSSSGRKKWSGGGCAERAVPMRALVSIEPVVGPCHDVVRDPFAGNSRRPKPERRWFRSSPGWAWKATSGIPDRTASARRPRQ